MWKQAVVAAALVALAGGCEDRTTRTTTGRVTGSDNDATRSSAPSTTVPSTTTPAPATDSTMSPPAGINGTPSDTLSTDATPVAQPDADFLKKAASINMLEVDVGKLALDQSQNDDVRTFAQMIEKDHADARDRLHDVASRLKVEFPTQVLPEHQKIEDNLKSMKGSQFDQEFVKDMIDGHKQAIDLFQQEANSGQNDQIKAYAQGMIPSLQMHLDHATDLQRKLGSANTPDMGAPPASPTKEPG